MTPLKQLSFVSIESHAVWLSSDGGPCLVWSKIVLPVNALVSGMAKRKGIGVRHQIFENGFRDHGWYTAPAISLKGFQTSYDPCQGSRPPLLPEKEFLSGFPLRAGALWHNCSGMFSTKDIIFSWNSPYNSSSQKNKIVVIHNHGVGPQSQGWDQPRQDGQCRWTMGLRCRGTVTQFLYPVDF